MQILESKIEKVFREEMRMLGIVTLKLNVLFQRGWPDRLIVLPGGKAIFVEFKAPGGITSELQKHRIKQLKALGFEVKVYDTSTEAIAWVRQKLKEQVDA